ncbi:MAG: redoxin family protein [Candidatus Eremiobacteraeota bacterium]|nr:redoxin family protein [Candidatus Eremiobacteraeota bacterium]
MRLRAVSRAWVASLGAGFAALLLALHATPAQARSDVTQLASFEGATAWLNAQALSPADLKGKIVLVDFWEYTCVNCLRTLPYEKAWYERYKPYGFEIVGVHTPEFAFGAERANVAAALQRLGITWPVALDNERAIWNRYHNDSWPHEFLFDTQERLVREHVGEGDYPQTERMIAQLVRAAHPGVTLPPVMALLPQDSYTKPGAVCYPQTPEVYAQAALGNREGHRSDEVVGYHDPVHGHRDGLLYLDGPWFNAREAVVHARADTSARDHIALRYHAIQVVAVLKPESGKPMTVYIRQDGAALSPPDAGEDVHYDARGRSYIVVDAARAYDLVMNRHFGHHDLELAPREYGLGVYSFAFESCQVGVDR